MILMKKKFNSQLREAFTAHQLRDNCFLVKTSDRDISLNCQALLVLSPFFRALMSSVPCCTTPTLLLPEFTSASVELFMSMVSEGTTNKAIRSAEDAADVIKLAKSFDIDASNYSVVVPDEEVVTIIDEAEVVKKDRTLNVSLDENVSQSESEDLICQICLTGFTKLSQLMVHYVLAHFMKELDSEFRLLATDKTCHLCAKECKTKQQLYVHIGVKHKKINIILAKHGYKEHIKKVKSVLADRLRNEQFLDASDVSVQDEEQLVVMLDEYESIKEDTLMVLEEYESIKEDTKLELSTSKIIPNKFLEESVSALDFSFTESQGYEDFTCQICFTGHAHLSQLLIHYVLAHYMKELDSEFGDLATDKICNLCAKECKTKQQLYVHIGVKHKKINSILAKHGYKEHRKVRVPNISNKEKIKTNCCQLCDKNIEGLSSLWQHYTNSHFQNDLRESYSNLMDLEEIRCKLCAKQMKQKQGLLVHIGTVHLKVNEVLVKYGLKPLDVKDSKLEKSINLDNSQD
eukprot:GFUD01038873.1.p1 GENE.GFUD01038873.1~~GFUD01038873.1.p1  ORF type:complete len:517 (-),score=80.92 GFUD01038873.1:14-1564(-)